MSRNIFDVDVDSDIETGMNLAALQYDLKLCREHGRAGVRREPPFPSLIIFGGGPPTPEQWGGRSLVRNTISSTMGR
jgi:hypothetical protein